MGVSIDSSASLRNAKCQRLGDSYSSTYVAVS